jgi:hypothetical protein
MLDPWTTPGKPNSTRYICPLDDWYHDEPDGEPFGGIIGYKARAERIEALIRSHIEEHALEEWVKAATRLHLLLHEASALVGVNAPDPGRLEDALTVSEARWLTLARPIIETLTEATNA